MYFFVTAAMIRPDNAADYRDEETRALNELRAEGANGLMSHVDTVMGHP